MQIRRWLSLLGLLSLWAVCLSCGQNYRLPIIQIPGDPGDPKLYHFAMTISTNDPSINSNIPGTVMQEDVVGDSDVGEALVGRGPTFATLLPTGAANRIYVINGLEETVSTTTAAPQSCSPGPVCPIGTVSTISMPTGSAPSYLNSTETSNMYVLLPGPTPQTSGTPPMLGVIAVFQNALTKQIALPPGNPVAMVELPNGHKMYVLDQANDTVDVVNTSTQSVVATVAVGSAPSMALASPDNSAVYVMTSSGISVIDALTDQLIPGTLSTGGQPTSIAFDTNRVRLYITDANGRVGVFDAAQAGGVLPTQLLISAAGFAPGAIGVAPLPDGSRFYILGTTGGTSLTLTAVDSKTLQMVPSVLPAAPNPYPLDALNAGSDITATPPVLVPAATVSYCSSVRYRYMVGASGDSGRVYVSSCDAGGTYIFRTTDDTGVLFLPSPNQPPVNNTFKPQNPVFLIAGR